MSCGGGLVSWWQKVKTGQARAFNIAEFIGEVVTSAVVGVAMFMAARAADMPEGLCAAMASVAGHMGTRLMFLAETLIEGWLKKKVEQKT